MPDLDRFTIVVDFTKGKHFWGWRQQWGSDFARELVSLRPSPPRFREWHPDKRLEVPWLSYAFLHGLDGFDGGRSKVSQQLELIFSTCSIKGQTPWDYTCIICSSSFFTMIFVTWHVQLETQGRESAGHSCFPVASRGENPLFTMILLVSPDMRFQQLVVVCRGRGESSRTKFLMKRYEKAQDEGWMKATRTVALLQVADVIPSNAVKGWFEPVLIQICRRKKCRFVDVVHAGQCYHALWPT